MDLVHTKRALDEEQMLPPPKKSRVAGPLEAAVGELLHSKAHEDFPSRCLGAATSDLGRLVTAHSVKDNIGLAQHDAPGKSLGMVLLLAAAAATYGTEAVSRARAQYDAARRHEGRKPSRNWMSWIKNDRRHAECLRSIATAKWSYVQAHLDGDFSVADDTDAGAADASDSGSAAHSGEDGPPHDAMPENVLRCFTEHGDALSMSDDDMRKLGDDYTEGWRCDLCDANESCGRAFYHCNGCRLDYCAMCEQRRENFQDADE